MSSNILNKENVNEEKLATETYARMLPELDGLSLEELTVINLDIPSTVATTLGALPEIRALRADIEEELPKFDMAAFDKLEDYAFTLNVAHARYLAATQPPDDAEALSAEAAALRETLLVDATALSHRGFVNGKKLSELRGPNGLKNLATDLAVLATVLEECLPAIQGRSSIQPTELERAVKLGQRLMRIAGLREQGPASVDEATDKRTRAFTLLSRTYDSARRAVTYLRWNAGDVDRIAPSLYAGRSNGRRKSTEAPAPVPPAATPSPTPAAQPVGTAQTAPEGATQSAAPANPFGA